MDGQRSLKPSCLQAPWSTQSEQPKKRRRVLLAACCGRSWTGEWPSLRSLCKAAVQWQRCWPPITRGQRHIHRATCVTKVSRAAETLEPTSAGVVFKLTTAVKSAVLEMSKRAVGFCVVALLSKTYHIKQRAALSFFSWVALTVYSRGLGGRKASSSSGHPFRLRVKSVRLEARQGFWAKLKFGLCEKDE